MNIFGIDLDAIIPVTLDELKIELRPRALQIKDHLRELGDYYTLKRSDRALHDLLTDELKDIQKSCYHTWDYVSVFNFVRAICTKCDYEDKSYNHALHGRRLPSGRR